MWRWLSSMLILATLSLTPVYAQSGGSTTALVIGQIKDPQGKAIVGATITAKQLETNLLRTIQTTDDGSFIIAQLPPGNYQIMAQAEGFSSQSLPITLTIGTTTLANFSLTVGTPSEVIEVTADSSTIIEPTKTQKSTIINATQIVNLPINRRNFLDFALTTSGVVQDRGRFQGAQATSGLSFSGQNPRQNNITIDGIDNNDNYAGSVRATYSQEAVKEFQVVSNGFSAEFGRAQGGLVNIVTRTGSNSYEGTLFFLNRNDSLSARNAFSGANKPSFSQYQYGLTLGGPIKKDKAFFFASFERLNIKDSVNVDINAVVVASLNRRGFPVRVGDIPFSEASSTFLLRNDFKLSDKDQVAVRYNFGRIYNGALATFGGGRAESQGGTQQLRDDTLSVSNTRIAPSLNLVNETRFLFARRDLKADSLDPRSGPRLQAGAAVGQDPFLPNPRKEFIFEIVNNTSLVRGINQIKFGVDYLRVHLPKKENLFPAGFFGQATFSTISLSTLAPPLTLIQAFDPALRTPQQQAALKIVGPLLPGRFPGFPLTDLTTIELPTIFIQGFGDPSIEMNYQYISGFFQDDIRLTPKLTAKLGLRYDQERVDFLPKNKGNFSPRVSLAYNPWQRLNLHASYGIFHGITPIAPVMQAGLEKVNGFKQLILFFPYSIIPFSLPGNRFPTSTTLPTGVTYVRQLSGESDIQKDFRNGYAQQVHVGFDVALDKNTSFSASYQYVRGISLPLRRDINPIVRPIVGDPIGSRVKGRIDTNRGGVLDLESNGDSYYNALTLELSRGLGSRLKLLTNYTFGKALDDFSDYRLENAIFQNPLDLRHERGFSIQDIRHRFSLSAVWSLDYTKNQFLKDFVLSSIVRLEGGQPYYYGLGFDKDLSGDLIAGDRPNNVARNIGILDGFYTVDLRLLRKIKIREKVSIEGIFEGFNLFNRVNYSRATLAATLADGIKQDNGRFKLPKQVYSSAFSPRQLQLGFKVIF